MCEEAIRFYRSSNCSIAYKKVGKNQNDKIRADNYARMEPSRYCGEDCSFVALCFGRHMLDAPYPR